MDYFRLMARFNAWANTRLYDTVATLGEEPYRRERGLFFGSIHGTLNHLLVVDHLWTGRLAGEDHGTLRLTDILHASLADLRTAREAADARFIAVVEGLHPASLDAPVTYRKMLGEGSETVTRAQILATQLNHQTYHRGQVVAALNQDGIEPPPLDVIFYLEDLGQVG